MTVRVVERDTVVCINVARTMPHNWQQAMDAVSAIVPEIHQWGWGLELYFSNHVSAVNASGLAAGGYYNPTTAQEVQGIFDAVQPNDSIPDAEILKRNLNAYLRKHEQQRNINENISYELHICYITEGEHNDKDALTTMVRQYNQTLVRLGECENQISIDFFQVDSAEAAVEPQTEQRADDIGDMVSDGNLKDALLAAVRA